MSAQTNTRTTEVRKSVTSSDDETMVVVAGHCRFPAEHRDAALAGYRTLIEAARRAPGCIDLSITADPIDPERIDICEIWAGGGATECVAPEGAPPPEGAARGAGDGPGGVGVRRRESPCAVCR